MEKTKHHNTMYKLTIHYLKHGVENKIYVESTLRSDLEDIVRQISLEGVITIEFDHIIK